MDNFTKKRKLYRLVKAARVISMLFYIGGIIALSFLILALVLRHLFSAYIDKTAYFNTDLLSYFFPFVLFCFLAFLLAISKSKHRATLISIAFIIYAASGLLPGNSSPALFPMILNILSCASLIVLSLFLLQKTKNKTIPSTCINAIFIAFISINIISIIYSFSNFVITKIYPSGSVIFVGIIAASGFILTIFLWLIPFKALKDPEFYKAFILSHPKYFLKNKLPKSNFKYSRPVVIMPQDNTQPHDSNEPTASVEDLEDLYGKKYWLSTPAEDEDLSPQPKRPKIQIEKGRLIALIITCAATVAIIIIAVVLKSGSYY